MLPVDYLAAKSDDLTRDAGVARATIPAGYEGVDIGPKTIALYRRARSRPAGTVIWNGPVGWFEEAGVQQAARKGIAEAMAASAARHRRRRRRDGRGGRAVRLRRQDDARLHRRRGVPGLRRGEEVPVAWRRSTTSDAAFSREPTASRDGHARLRLAVTESHLTLWRIPGSDTQYLARAVEVERMATRAAEARRAGRAVDPLPAVQGHHLQQGGRGPAQRLPGVRPPLLPAGPRPHRASCSTRTASRSGSPTCGRATRWSSWTASRTHQRLVEEQAKTGHARRGRGRQGLHPRPAGGPRHHRLRVHGRQHGLRRRREADPRRRGGDAS